MEHLIEIKGLKKHFGNLKVLNDIHFYIDKGEVVCLIGSSGSGKSTLLRCINVLETPDGGEILIHGKDILKGAINVNQHRVKVGMVFQSFNLFNNIILLIYYFITLDIAPRMPSFAFCGSPMGCSQAKVFFSLAVLISACAF